MRFLPALLALLLALPARALLRTAVVVGTNEGDAGEETLLYAEKDAHRVARALQSVGRFAPEDVRVLAGADAPTLRRVLIETNARLRETPGDSLLFVYYSGHADTGQLHLRGTRLRLAELRQLVAGSSADARVLVLDACGSGGATRLKGGRPGPSFSIDPGETLDAEGLAILASSGANEASQESDSLGASFFTHAFTSALLGAGDRDRDGRITLHEAFAYASERTLAMTSSTQAGPQHPAFWFQLAGKGDLVLARPGEVSNRWGSLVLAASGTYLIHAGNEEGPVVAEAAVEEPGVSIVLPPGRYVVDRREPERLHRGTFTLEAGKPLRVEPDALRRFEYARLVRKGGDRPLAYTFFAHRGARTGVLELGTMQDFDAGFRLDAARVAFELRAGLGLAHARSTRLDIVTSETLLTLTVAKAFDLGPLVLSGGWEMGGVRWRQSFPSSPLPDRRSLGMLFGPVMTLEWPLFRGGSLRLNLSAGSLILPQGNDRAREELKAQTFLRMAAGASWSIP